jgi:tetratricopeptide (TPR) repeat protein
MYKWLIIILFSLICFSANAQKRMTIGHLDTLTYKKYMNGDWDAVIKYGNNAIKHHIDFYYLRCRMGYAYYMKKKYRASAFEYEKALALYPEGTEALEYLYNCYIENQEFDRASLVYKKFSDELKSRIHDYRIPIVKNIQMNSGIKHTNVSQSLRDMTFTSVALGHYVAPGLSLFHQYSGLQQDLYSSSIRQHQYYVSAHLPLKKGWQIMPAIHYIKTNVLPVTPTPPKSASLQMIDSSNSFVGSLLISKAAKNFEVGYNISFSNFNSGNQMQNNLFVFLFPLSNNNLSIGVSFSALNQSKNFRTQTTEKLKNNQTRTITKDSLAVWKNYIPRFQINYKPVKQFEMQAFYTLPNAINNNELNGLIANNSIDITKQKMGTHLQWNIYKTVSVYVDYQFENKHKEKSSFYNLNTQALQTVNAFDYVNHIVFAGIKIYLY